MEMYEDEWDLVENAPGLFIHEAREAKGYIMEEISHGICSLATLKRIEKGERNYTQKDSANLFKGINVK